MEPQIRAQFNKLNYLLQLCAHTVSSKPWPKMKTDQGEREKTGNATDFPIHMLLPSLFIQPRRSSIGFHDSSVSWTLPDCPNRSWVSHRHFPNANLSAKFYSPIQADTISIRLNQVKKMHALVITVSSEMLRRTNQSSECLVVDDMLFLIQRSW